MHNSSGGFRHVSQTYSSNQQNAKTRLFSHIFEPIRWRYFVCPKLWYGIVWYIFVKYGISLYHMVWYGLSLYGMAYLCMVWYLFGWFGLISLWMVWYDISLYGMVYLCRVWYGKSYSDFWDAGLKGGLDLSDWVAARFEAMMKQREQLDDDEEEGDWDNWSL